MNSRGARACGRSQTAWIWIIFGLRLSRPTRSRRGWSSSGRWTVSPTLKARVISPRRSSRSSARAGRGGNLADPAQELPRPRSRRESLETEARHFVEAEHDWNILLQRLVELVEAVGAREHKLGRSNTRAVAGS